MTAAGALAVIFAFASTVVVAASWLAATIRNLSPV